MTKLKEYNLSPLSSADEEMFTEGINRCPREY
jgi:hypothetical protein